MPHKSGNVYVNDDAVHGCLDYDVPTTRRATQQPATVSFTTAVDCLSSQDYDIPPNGASASSTSCRYNGGDDVDFGVGDYDLLSPPPSQRPASDVDCSLSSNRSSVTSVMSAGSLSSGCASIRSAQSASVGVARSAAGPGLLRVNGFPGGPHVVDQLVPRLWVTSDSSADSGIALPAAVLVDDAASTALNGVSCRRDVDAAADDADCFDYDVPVASVNDTGRPADTIDERLIATPQRLQCQQSPVKHISPVNSDELDRRDDNRCANDVRRRRVDELRDCVTRSVQRFIAWTGRATGNAAATDATTARQCYGQAKLAGLAVRTSLKELVAVVDGNPPELLHCHLDALRKLLVEIDRRLDSLIECGSEGRSRPLIGGRRAARQSSACRDRLLALAEVVAGLPEPVKQFSDFVATTPAVVLRPLDDFDVVQSPPPSAAGGKVLPPVPTQRRDSLQRDRPPLSPPAGVGPRGRRPPLGKPPPVKPKPPKSVTWKRPPPAPVQPRPAGSPATPTMNGTENSAARYDRRVAELNRKNGASTDGWNEDDCDYVSIVREVEREMQSSVRPVTKTSTTPPPPLDADPRRSACLDDDDRELLAFFSAQISAHSADVDGASAEFYRCCASSSPSVDAFVRRSRFVVLAAHRLVYVGDVIARHVTNQSVRDRVAAAANALCDRLKVVVMATRDAAVATVNNENAVAVSGTRQTMMDSVRHATDDCRRLCDVISSVSR